MLVRRRNTVVKAYLGLKQGREGDMDIFRDKGVSPNTLYTRSAELKLLVTERARGL